MTGAALIKRSDKNGDGVLTIEEIDGGFKAEFKTNDANGDGQLGIHTNDDHTVPYQVHGPNDEDYLSGIIKVAASNRGITRY